MTLQDLINDAQKEAVSLQIASGFVGEAAAEVAKDNHANAVNACKGLVQVATNTLKQNVAQLRVIREQEKTQAAKVKRLDKVTKYFAATGNPFPMFAEINGNKKGVSSVRAFCETVGIAVPSDDAPAWDIPSDWTGLL